MPLLTTQYVYFGASGAHTRQPRATTSYGGFTPIPGLNPSPPQTLAPGTSFQPLLPFLTYDVGSLDLQWALTNVSGLVEGPRFTNQPGGYPPPGTVGTSPVLVVYLYVPVGGTPGPGDSGAVIDAFNESTGALVDNDFVTVSPDPGGTLTTEANVEGWVDTASSGYTIAADHPNIGPYMSLPMTALFDQWTDLTNPSPLPSLISGANLTPGQGETVYALALYKDPVKTKEHFDKPIISDVFTSKWVSEIFKGPKESVESQGWGDIGDPELIVAEIAALNARISQLQVGLQTMGRAFIRSEDRPPVGERGDQTEES
ncbi:MAG: hypothetical protein WA431_18070 [Candidatus Cybelea sp.]